MTPQARQRPSCCKILAVQSSKCVRKINLLNRRNERVEIKDEGKDAMTLPAAAAQYVRGPALSLRRVNCTALNIFALCCTSMHCSSTTLNFREILFSAQCTVVLHSTSLHCIVQWAGVAQQVVLQRTSRPLQCTAPLLMLQRQSPAAGSLQRLNFTELHFTEHSAH